MSRQKSEAERLGERLLALLERLAPTEGKTAEEPPGAPNQKLQEQIEKLREERETKVLAFIRDRELQGIRNHGDAVIESEDDLEALWMHL